MPRPTSRTLGYLYDRFIGEDPEQAASYEAAKAEAERETDEPDKPTSDPRTASDADPERPGSAPGSSGDR